MTKLIELRDSIGDDAREVLGRIWSLFLESGEWPSCRQIYSEFGKEHVLAALTKTNGSVIVERLINGSKQFQLLGVAPLLTILGLAKSSSSKSSTIRRKA